MSDNFDGDNTRFLLKESDQVIRYTTFLGKFAVTGNTHEHAYLTHSYDLRCFLHCKCKCTVYHVVVFYRVHVHNVTHDVIKEQIVH